MWSIIEINDTLQITNEQWFPYKELDYEKHKNEPIKVKSLNNKIFSFKDKKKTRVYQKPPVRNFLVQNINGKWLYWWLVHIIEITHNNIENTTSGKFKIIYIYSPEEMKSAYKLIDRNKNTDFFE